MIDAEARFREALATAVDGRMDAAAVSQCIQYYLLLRRWGAVHNLSRHLEPETAARESFADSWLGLEQLERMVPSATAEGVDRAEGILDVGSGAGFPGLVAAIRWPHRRVTLVEPARKRVSFLEQVVAALGLTAVRVRAVRVEDVAGAYDLVMSRATVGVGKGYDALARRVAVGGHLALFVGPSLDASAWGHEATRLGLSDPERVLVHGGGDQRALAVARRAGTSP